MRCTIAVALAGLGVVAARPAHAQTARVSGVVYDSVARAPLGAATVQLVSADRATVRAVRTDSLGQFAFDTVASGTWLVGAQHPRLDALGVTQLARDVKVGRSGTVKTTLAVPSPRRLVAHVCGDSIAGDTLGYLRGTLRGATSARAGVAGRVRAEWLEWTLAKGGPRTSIASLEVPTAGDGAFVVCGVPREAHLRVRAWNDADSTGALDVETPESGIYARDLYLGPTATRVVRDSATVLRGPARLVGRTVRADGQPVEGVRVTVRESGQEALSGPDGRFLLDSLPLGTWTLGARAVGYAPSVAPVDLIAGDDASAVVALERLQYLDPVQVNARRSRLVGVDLREFEQRAKSGMGRYLDVTAIDKYAPIWPSDLFIRFPGLQVAWGLSGPQVRMKQDFGTYCGPLVFVDGRQVSGDDRFVEGDLDYLVDLDDVLGVEIYNRKTLAPPQFQSFTSDCGALVFWTGRKRLERIGVLQARKR
ncbi:MAG: carboxypeptidase-like regulatory domain-containing protein [Gemmatimonadetes bacterium]|nr:carboxypeptidase-like regulatory domain-containing protein [Gemmatimonadota bacterium]